MIGTPVNVQRQRRRRLVLERHLLAGDRDRFRVPGQVELQRARERSPCTRARRASGIRRRAVTGTWSRGATMSRPGREDVDGPGGGGERGAEARPAIPHRQAVHLQLRDRDEPVQLAVPGAQGGRVEGHLDPPEGQREGAAPRDDLRPVLRGEGRGQRPVVQVRRDPEPGVEPPRGHARLLRGRGRRRRRRRPPGRSRASSPPGRAGRTARPGRRAGPGPPAPRPSPGAARQWRPRDARRRLRRDRARRARCASASSARPS